MRKEYLVFIISLMAILLFAKTSYAATYYMNPNGTEDCSNLQECFSLMSGGDTLIIRDGTYTGADNAITPYNLPPSGSETLGYTTIKAEHTGKVIFDGENDRSMVFIGSASRNIMSYVIFKGIVWIHKASDKSHLFSGLDNVKIIECGFGRTKGGGSSNFLLRNSNNVLVEGCYSWGNGRYAFMVQTSDYIIFRRNVGRLDAADGGGYPIAVFQDYCSRHVEYQNNIAIDINDSYFKNWSYSSGAFSLRKGPYNGYYSEDVSVRGNIALNIDWWKGGTHSTIQGVGFRPTLDNRLGHDNYYENNIAWDVPSGGTITGVSQGGATNIKNMNIFVRNGAKDPDDKGYIFRGPSEWRISNSILIHGDRAGLRGGINSDYNVLWDTNDNYADGCSEGIHDYSLENNNEINPLTGMPGNGIPCLKYLPRIEEGSDCYGTGEGGSNRGATILYKIGRDGTLWGEPGWNETTNESLWPWPNEDLIKEMMSQYYYDDPNDNLPPLRGDRGFCKNGTGLYGGPITLTSYIWEYLGNPCPPEICNYSLDYPNCSEGKINETCYCKDFKTGQNKLYSSGYCYNNYWHDKSWNEFVIFADDFSEWPQYNFSLNDWNPPGNWTYAGSTTPTSNAADTYNETKHFCGEVSSPGMLGLSDKSHKIWRHGNFFFNYCGELTYMNENLFGNKEIYNRWYMKIPKDFSLSENGCYMNYLKLWRYIVANKAECLLASWCPGSFEIYLNFNGPSFSTAFLQIGKSINPGSGWHSLLPVSEIRDGKWHSYELRIKLNDPGQANGEISFWLDGKKRKEFINLDLGASADMSFSKAALGIGNTGARNCNPPGEFQSEWRAIEFDNYVLSKEYIGHLPLQYYGDILFINPQPTGTLPANITQTNISLNTNKQAICKYSTTPGLDYSQMQSTFSITNSTHHSQLISNLTDGTDYTFYVKCIDLNGTVNENDFLISFSVASNTPRCFSNADLNTDGRITTRELIRYIRRWLFNSGVSLRQIIQAIREWKWGC